ncbi:MAG: type II secretion system protein [Clostridia bacterium]|nr:type II secretion system protein [Clostridia bacterium]
MTKANSKRARGFTLIELVVAIAMILIVSGAGVLLVTTQTRVDAQANQAIEATNISENAIDCFRFAVNDPNNTDKEKVIAAFKTALENTGIDIGDPVNGKFSFENDKTTIEITITQNDDKSYTIHIYAKDSFDKEIIDETYTK